MRFTALGASNRGTAIGPVGWAPWDKMWQATLSEKKQIFGASNRHDVGGPAPAGCVPLQRKEDDNEPVFFHALPVQYYEFMLNEFRIVGTIDTTPGPGHAAFAHIKKKIPYTGICFNEKHVPALQDHLVTMIMKAFADEQEKSLYTPQFAELLKVAKAKKKPAPKKKAKDAAAAEEEEEAEEDDDDSEEGKNPKKPLKKAKPKGRKALMATLTKLRGASGKDDKEDEGDDDDDEDSAED